ncbi:hypothetical protein C2G38_2066124, partial [Gigaspora rosea]
MISLSDWLEQAVENRDIDLINFDLNLVAKKKRSKDGVFSRPCVFLNNSTDFDDIIIDEEEMKAIFSVGFEHEKILKAFISQSAKSLEYYLLVEIADQGNLASYLEKTKLTWDKKIDLASLLISGLEFLHSQQIVHSNLVNDLYLYLGVRSI